MLPGLPRAFAAEPPREIPADVPPWLRPHVGTGDAQIAPVVLQRARGLYLEKVREGKAKNPCYFAKDATRPAGTGRRFYVICEADQKFRAISSGHGNGRKLRAANFANGIRCAKNFSNAEGSKLTTGGAYVTAETRPSFKGYYRSRGKRVPLVRSFLQFEGEGDTANARERAIGGHPAVLLRARQWKEAVEALDRRYKLEPDVAEQAAGELRKAAIFRNLAANDDEARQAYEKARQLDPMNPEATTAVLAGPPEKRPVRA